MNKDYSMKVELRFRSGRCDGGYINEGQFLKSDRDHAWIIYCGNYSVI
ncbi:hypothetical protein [Edaphovirga cremea]|nr:hypothetical protein [Edaphovirga cremea]